ncbi:hypothetical protein [Comamonas terrigena]|uniref:hypothetical protein n=1 Tax=Comamonas terrigena TaxID=32013 RepID=UPI002448B0DA|nr:hypothetical protein [Comamonas terrigena]MDH1701854.1 hypothetical protein [Comamonas terrigena]
MKDIIIRTGTSVLSAVIIYIALTAMSDGLSIQKKIIIAVALGVVAFAASIWASSKSDRKSDSKIEALTDLKGDSATIEDLTVLTEPEQSIRVVSNLDVSGAIQIKGVKVGQPKKTSE